MMILFYLLGGLNVAEAATCYPPCRFNEECTLIGRGQIPTCVTIPSSTTPYYTQDCQPPFPICDFWMSCRRKSDGTQDCYPYCIPSCSAHESCFWGGPGILPVCQPIEPPACILPCPIGQYCQLDVNWNQYCAVAPTTTLPPCILPCSLGQECQYDQYGKPYCAAPPCDVYYRIPDPPVKTTLRPPSCKPPCKRGFRCKLDVGIARCYPNNCPAYEVVNNCGNLCENKCKSLCKPEGCPKICNPPACACDSDHYRNAAGRCVAKDQCPSKHAKACRISTSECPTTPVPKYP